MVVYESMLFIVNDTLLLCVFALSLKLQPVFTKVLLSGSRNLDMQSVLSSLSKPAQESFYSTLVLPA